MAAKKSFSLKMIALRWALLLIIVAGSIPMPFATEMKSASAAGATGEIYSYLSSIERVWQFASPQGVAVDSTGNVYVADTGNNRIQKFDAQGTLLTQWGSLGNGPGQFTSPQSIATDAAGYVYVADTGNHRVQKFNAAGIYISQWGGAGSGDGKLSSPQGVAVDGNGNVYVADTGNHRIQKFDAAGGYLSQWGGTGGGTGQFSSPAALALDPAGNIYVADTGNSRIQIFDPAGAYVRQFGGAGSGNGQMLSPAGIAIRSDGTVYVADTGNNRIEMFDAASAFVDYWGDAGAAAGQFSSPGGLAVDRTGNILVADRGNHRVQLFDASGSYRAQWGTVGNAAGQFASPNGVAVDDAGNIYVADTDNHRIEKFDASGAFVMQWGGLGTGNGQLNSPRGIAVDGAGNVYVADTGNHRIQKFSPEGVYARKWGGKGSGGSQFSSPSGVAVDGAGSVYVADTDNHRIQKFDASGTLLAQWGGLGTGSGKFNHPRSVAANGIGEVYVADTDNHRIQKFAADGSFVGAFGTNGSGDGQLKAPSGVAVDLAGYVYAADTNNHRMQKFNAAGAFVAKWGESGGAGGQFSMPGGVAVSPAGTVIVADTKHNRIQLFRSVTYPETAAYASMLAFPKDDAKGNLYFNVPLGLAVDQDGNVIVADKGNNQMQKFDPAGTSVTKWGNYGGGNSQFNDPYDVAIDYNSGLIYVTDTRNVRVQVFDASGAFVRQWPASAGLTSIAVDGDGYVYVTSGFYYIDKYSPEGALQKKWGGWGSGNGQFYSVGALTVDGQNNVYVSGSGYIQKFDADGNFIEKWGKFNYGINDIVADPAGNIYATESWNNKILKISSTGTVEKEFGGRGQEAGKFVDLRGIALDGAGNVYVTDMTQNSVQKFDSTGNFVQRWGIYGNEDGKFWGPKGLALDQEGQIYVSDTGNNRIQKFDASGAFTLKWGEPGNGSGQFNAPGGVAVGGDGGIYVADTNNHRVQKFDASGVFIKSWGEQGVGEGQFNSPEGVAVDGAGNVYVADTGNHRIQKFDAKGAFLVQWGGSGNGPGRFASPRGVVVDRQGHVYVADTSNHRVQKFDASGVYLKQWGTYGGSIGQFNNPGGIGVDGGGNVYVVDTGNNRIQKFSPDGIFASWWGGAGIASGQFNSPQAVVIDKTGKVYVAESGNNRIQAFRPSSPQINDATLNGTDYSAEEGRNRLIVSGIIADPNAGRSLSMRYDILNEQGQTVKTVTEVVLTTSGNLPFQREFNVTSLAIPSGQYSVKVSADDGTNPVVASPLLPFRVTIAPLDFSLTLTTADGKVYAEDTWTNQDVQVQVNARANTPGETVTVSLEVDENPVPYANDSVYSLTAEGVHTLLFKAADTAGNRAELSVTVKIDKTKPVITLHGADMTITAGEAYQEPGADAVDAVGQLAGPIVVTGTVNTQAIGTYTIRYNATDLAGNAADEAVRTVHVDPPTPALNAVALNRTALSAAEGFNELTVTGVVYGTYAGWPIAVTYTIENSEGTSVASETESLTPAGSEQPFSRSFTIETDKFPSGEYSLTVAVSDGVHDPASRRIGFAVNTLPPVLHAEMVTQDDGKPYSNAAWTRHNVDVSVTAEVSEPSTTAALELDVDGSGYRSYPGGTVYSVTEEGTSMLKFRATDDLGNVFLLPLTVNIDKTKPAILLRGAPEVTIKAGDAYNDPGADATDNVGLSGEVTVTGEPPNTLTPGTYTIAYDAYDLAGNAAETATRKLIIEAGPPVLSGVALNKDDLSTADGFNVLTVSGSVAGQIDSSMLTMTYTIKDGRGQVVAEETSELLSSGSAQTFSQSFTISADKYPGGHYSILVTAADGTRGTAQAGPFDFAVTAAPMSLNATMTTTDGAYTNSSWTNNNVNIQITANAARNRTVNMSVSTDNGVHFAEYPASGTYAVSEEGAHALIFRAVDDLGNIAYLPLSVNIDRTKPVIILKGSATVRLTVGEVYRESGFDASDNVGTDGEVTVTGTVDTQNAGTYTLRYHVKDIAGNTTEAVRTVTVAAGSTGGGGDTGGNPGGGGTPGPGGDTGSPGAGSTTGPGGGATNPGGGAGGPGSGEGKGTSPDETNPADPLKDLLKAVIEREPGVKLIAFSGLSANKDTVLSIDGKATLQIMKQKFKDSTGIGAGTIEDTAKYESGGLDIVGSIYELKFDKPAQLDQPATLTIKFDLASVQDLNQLAVYWFNDRKERWEYVGGQINPVEGTITAKLPHFSKYALATNGNMRTFTDMKERWSNDAVYRLASIGIVSGEAKNGGYLFQPTRAITRQEFAKLLVAASDVPVSTAPLGDTIADRDKVPAWTRAYMATAVGKQWFGGVTKNGASYLEPQRPITRAEAAAVIGRMLNGMLETPEAAARTPFRDEAKIPAWAKGHVVSLQASGILSGYPDDTFRPDDRITREEAAAMIGKMLDLLYMKGKNID